MDEDLLQSSAVEWTERKAALVWEVAVEGKAKDKMVHKSAHNAKLRHFSRGDQVLVHACSRPWWKTWR